MSTPTERRTCRQRRGRTVAWLVAGTSLLLNSACYSYLPAPGAAPVTDTDVRIELTSDGSDALRGAVGPRIRLIEGRVRGTDAAGTATVDVEQLTSWDGLVVLYTGRDPVRIARSNIARTDFRSLDRKKSWVAAGVITGVFMAAVVTALLKARSKASGDPGRIGGSPPDIKAP